MNASITCRLCGGLALYQFNKRVLNRFEVKYYRCEGCESLQTEEPTWLDEAYLDGRRWLDTGSVGRNLRMQVGVYYAARAFGFGPADKLLDWGAGDGLLVRLLRDIGMNAYGCDKYAVNFYAPGFIRVPSEHYKMITAFEVWEHLPQPGREVKEIFDNQPEVHMLSTELYKGQREDWHYLSPEAGRHVFFYSSRAMEWVARRFGYHVTTLSRGVTIFHKRPLTVFRQWQLSQLLSLGLRGRVIRAWFDLASRPSLCAEDQLSMRKVLELNARQRNTDASR